jgi:glycosyltransferase involved in cell wall biosynthesis
LNYCNKIICSSDFVKNNFFKNIKENIITITPGVDISKFKPVSTSLKNNILFIGNFTEGYNWKGLDYLIEAVKNIKNSSLVVIGEGNSKDILNINFKGIKTGNELIKEIQRCSILVLPSISPESFGIVLIEAMACKKPVIGSNIGGIPYVIDNEVNGLLVPPKDSPALADAIIKILKNPTLAKKMGENGYKKVKENFTLDIQNKKMNEILKEALKK